MRQGTSVAMTAGHAGLDLTPRAFDAIANRSAGVITVKYEVLGS